jgi:hypothetical protein
MSIPASFVPAFRTMRSDRYVDSCVAVRVAGVSFNESTGRTEPTTAQVYAGACLVRPATASTKDFGVARRQIVDYDLYLPFDAAELTVDDSVTVTSTLDPDIPVLLVLRGFQDSYLTHRHYECRVVLETEESSSSSSSGSSSSSSSS